MSEYEKFYVVCPKCQEWDKATTKQGDSSYHIEPWQVYNEFSKFICKWEDSDGMTSPRPIHLTCSNCQHTDSSKEFICEISEAHTCRTECPECNNVEETDGIKMHQGSTGVDYCVLISPHYKEFTIKIDSKAVSEFQQIILEARCNQCCNWKYTRPDVS
jgi:hypothetical protein